MEAFPYYLSIGMTEEQYWERDPYLTKIFYKAHLMKIESKNQELWMQGFYFYNAISTAFSNLFRKKGQPQERYLEKPIRITPLSDAEKREQRIKEREKIISELSKWEKSWKKRYSS